MGISLLFIIQAAVALWGIGWILRVRSKSFPEYKASWRSQLAGLSLIVLGTLGMAGLSLTKGSMAGTLLLTSLYLTGMFLFLAGLSRWLVPILEGAREGLDAQRRLAFLKNLNRKLAGHGEVKDISQAALSELLETFRYQAGAIYYQEALTSNMSLVASLGASSKTLPGVLERNQWKRKSIQKQSDKQNQVQAGAFPLFLRAGSRIMGLALLWPDKRANPTVSDQGIVELWSKTLALALLEQRNLKLKELRQKSVRVMNQISFLADQHETLDTLFPKVATQIKELVEYQVCCLVTLDKSCQNMERYTVGPAGNLLWEKGVSCCSGKTIVEKVCKAGQVLIQNGGYHQPSIERPSGLPILAACQSVLAVPLKTGKRVWGVMLLGHREQNRYRKIEGRFLQMVLHHLTFHLISLELRREIIKRDRLLSILEELGRQVAKLPDLTQRLNRISEVLSTTLPVTSCRISILGRDGSTLESLSQFSLRKGDGSAEPAQSIPLDRLPWHRLALLSSRPMLINQSDPESMMSKEEVRAAFTGPVNSVLLVPLVADQKTVGLLSLTEERDWNRRPFTYSEVLTAELAADRLGELVCHLFQNSPEEWPKPVQPDQLQIDSAVLRRQLSDPLCGILGASELILAKGDGLDHDSVRYAQIIHRMAERIRDWVQCESQPEAAVTS